MKIIEGAFVSAETLLKN